MKDEDKTKEQLLDELIQTRRRIAELEEAENERKEAEDALQQSESNYRTLFDQATDGIMVMPVGGTNFTVNESFAKLHGYSSPKEMEHLALSDLDTPETARLAPERLRRLLTGESMNFEVGHYHKNGHEVLLNVSCNVIQIGGESYFLGFHQDITERKHAETLLRIEHELALALGSASSISEAMERLLDAAMKIEGIDSGAVYLMNSARGGFQLVSHVGLSPSFIDRVSYYSPASPQARLVMQGEPTYWAEVSRMLDNQSLLEEEGLTSSAVIPVKSEGQVVAVLNLATRTQIEIPEGTRNALETIAASIGGIVFRVNVEEALRSSQERLNLALKSSKAGTWDRDIAADKAAWDEHIHRIFGLAPGSFSGKLEDFLDTVHPDDRERVRDEMTSAMDGSADYSTTYRVIWPNSSVHFLADRGKVYHYTAGRAMRMIGVCWDITEQKITDDALRESEVRLSLAINAAGAGLWVTEPETGHVWFTPKTRELFHFAPDQELNYESFFKVIHPEDHERVDQAVQQALQSGEKVQIEYRIVLPDGSVRWLGVRGQRYLKATGEPVTSQIKPARPALREVEGINKADSAK